ncbi:hypothetical protein RM572_03150 [Streptomyces sp. DSM 42041]|uniref:Uncharacterized protein n=1 Tax=Streptomyces hazeniae TaxID=3075538 RepID=A0ABU2NLB7_9ACTN|nr:hypothetical protein [Streptomyces sp. DSM 42041]MDT0377771.1 hypothetical protein [Streptomyces sp. DSM 42041]
METPTEGAPFTTVHDHLLRLVEEADLSPSGVPAGPGLLQAGLRTAMSRVSLQGVLTELRRWSSGHLRNAPGQEAVPEAAWCDLAAVSLRLALQLADEGDSLAHSSRGTMARSMTTAAYRRFWKQSRDPATGEPEDYTQALSRVFDEEWLRFLGRRTLPLYRRLATGAFAAARTDGGAGAEPAESATLRYVPARLAQIGGIEVPAGHSRAGQVLGLLVADDGWTADMAAARAPDRGGSVVAALSTGKLDTLLGLPPRCR